jgi:hypothetical protein
MMDRRPYSYVLLRYRHDALAGECANVGVVLHDRTTGFLGAKMRHSVGRLTKIFPDLKAATVKGALRSIESGVRRLAQSSGDLRFDPDADVSAFARRVLPADDSSFVWSQVGSGLTRDAAATLDELYQRFVGKYDDPARIVRDDAAVWRPVEILLKARNIADRLTPKIISSELEQVKFGHAWKNGAWHCCQPLSFDLASVDNIREKAVLWHGRLSTLRGTSEEFKPHFVVGAPSDRSLQREFDHALRILMDSPVKPDIVQEAEIGRLVDQIAHDVAAHDGAQIG